VTFSLPFHLPEKKRFFLKNPKPLFAFLLILYYISENIGMKIANGIYLVILILSLAVGIIGIYLFAKTEEDAFKLKKSQTLLGEKEKYKCIFTSPLIIIAIVMTLLETIFHRMG
jgi:hypothetical protein